MCINEKIKHVGWGKNYHEILKNIKVKVKLLVSFGIIIMFIVVGGAMGVNALKAVEMNYEEMYNNKLQSVYMTTALEKNLTGIENDLLKLLSSKGSSNINAINDDIKTKISETSIYNGN